MKVRYRIYFSVVFLIFCISFYFSMLFCSTYPYATSKWLQGFITGFIIDYFGIKLIVPAIKALLREYIIYTQSSIGITIYNFWVKVMALMKPKRISS